MRILIIDHYAGSITHGMEYRPYYFAKEWIKQGHSVDIIAADFSHLRKTNPEVSHDFQKELVDGIPYHWIKTSQYQGNGLQRALTMFQFAGKLWLNARKIAEEIKPDIVIASSTYPLDTYPARRIAKIAGAKEIHEVHDMWPATLIELGGMSRKNPFVMILQWAENAAYKKSDAVVSLLPCAIEYMVKHGLKKEKFSYLPNGIVLDDWKNPEPLPEQHLSVLENLKSQGKTIACYFGGHALSNNLDLLLDAAAESKNNKNLCYCFVGDGAEKQRLVERSKRENLDNVIFLPPIGKKAVPSLLEKIDVICICSKKSPLYKYGVSFNKMYDSMMSGKPIAASYDVPNDDVRENGCGISVPAEDAAAFARAIETIAGMSAEERAEMGKRGYEAAVEKYDYSKLAARFIEIMESI